VLREGFFEAALEQLPLPMYAMDRNGVMRWANNAAKEILGDVVGQSFVRFVVPEHLPLARKQFALKLLGGVEATDYAVDVFDRAGRRLPFRVVAVPLRDGPIVVGTFGYAQPLAGHADAHKPDAAAAPSLTPRQREALRLLGEGLSTTEIAERLGVAEETARNHIRAVLRQLGARSRLEAVVTARRLGLLTA